MKALAALAPALVLLGCGETQTPQPQPSPTPVAETNLAAEPAASPEKAPANVTDDGAPDLTPAPLTPEAERGVAGARNVLLSFSRAIELEEFGQAWALLSAADKAKWSKAQFAAMFADLGKIIVAIPTGEMEGAAGSSYYTAPITITGNDKTGRPIRYEGQAVLRRVNDVDGATSAQLRWHFEKLTLDWTH